MSTPVLYAMLIDDALKNITTTIDTSNSADQGYGQLSGEYGNYFNTWSTVQDTRTSRLDILDSEAAFGRMSIVFDSDQFDTANFRVLSEEELVCFLNIVERIYLQQNYTDSNLEYLLTNTSSFTGYVENSLAMDTATGTVTITSITKQTREVTLHNWISFDFQTDNITFKAHIWISSDSFGTEYPYTTITSVVPPCDPALLVDPATLVTTGVTDMMIDGSTFIFSDMHVETLARDQNGVHIFNTKYVVSGTTTLRIPFALPYRGANAPSNLESRRAIKDYLEENTDLTEEELEALFPELFVESRFFIVPLYDLYQETCDRVVYTSAYSYQDMIDRVNKVFGDYTSTFVEQYLEIFTNAQNTMLSVSLPDELNTGYFSIREQHPTYQHYSTSSPYFRYMESGTQEFAALLYRAFAVLQGDAVSTEFDTNIIDGITYLVFTSNKSEYLMMTQDSYMSLIS